MRGLLAVCSSGAIWTVSESDSTGDWGDWGQSGGMLGEGVREAGRGVMRWRTALRRLMRLRAQGRRRRGGEGGARWDKRVACNEDDVEHQSTF